LMERDKFLSAEEALEMGIVDEILDRRIKDEKKEDSTT
jgi:ATP-dependent Clp protease protease subunit